MDTALTFFGEVDRHPYSKAITSEFPAWYFTSHIEELREDIFRKNEAIRTGMVDRADVFRIEKEIETDERKLSLIEASIPKVSDARKTDLASDYKKLTKIIAEALPSYDSAKRGLVDAHEEVRKMSNPYIKVDTALAEACGVKIQNGAVSRDGAVKIWKIVGKFLGEPTNVESLRKVR